MGYVTLDRHGTIDEINLVGAAMLGTERARLVGQRLASWVTPATRPALEDLLAELQRVERASCDLAFVSREKAPLYVHVDAVPASSAHDPAWRCRAALTDLTEQKAAAALREADRRKSQFLAVLSHELRNPLAPIASAIQLLDHVPAGSEQALRARAVIERQTRHLGRLVDDLLDLTRISTGKSDLKLELVDLREVLLRTCEDYRASFEQGGVALRLEEPAGPVFVRGDPVRLAQVVGNLLHNAAKFTPRGGEASVTLGTAPGRAEIRVRDSGIGIERAQVGRLFEPFAQAEQGLARTHGGLGLGLSLVKELVELHGGNVRGGSEGIGRGSEFVVSLPLSAPPVGRPGPGRPRVTPRSIVVIEDNEDAGATFAELLALDGHEVQVALDGRSGIELARRIKPDVVFCDIGLPI